MGEMKMSWDAFHIAARAGVKSQWIPIGVAFLNKDQSINIFLDAFPKDGKIQLRSRESNKPHIKAGQGGII